MSAPRCPQCGVAMQPGFLMDWGNPNTANQAEFARGEPKGNLIFKSTVRKQDRFPVEAFRCDRCGVMQLYAPKAEA